MLVRKIRRILPKLHHIWLDWRKRWKEFPGDVMTWWVEKVKRRPVWYTDRFGITSQLRPGENIKHVILSRSHYDDPGVLYLLDRLLKPGMIVIDVGANKGDFALYAARCIMPGGHVHAFDPVPYAQDYFRENITQNPLLADTITYNPEAVYRENTEVVINIFPAQYFGWNGLGNTQMMTEHGMVTPVISQPVPAITIDWYCQKREIARIDLLKIDVEGFEPEVIEGAMQMITTGQVRYIIFEISLAPLSGANRSAQDVLNSVRALGLTIYTIEAGGGLLLLTEDAIIPFFANYLATLETQPVVKKHD